MNRNFVGIVWAKILLLVFLAAFTSAASFAQTEVEIEIAGPWSYVQDPADSSRIIIVSPNVGHTMEVFKGDDAFNYPPGPSLPLGSHRLDFATLSCGSVPAPSAHFLYPANGVSAQNIQNVLASGSVASMSLPKPCSYETQVEGIFKYNGIRKVTTSDPERSFTTWMTLHYKVTPSTTGAALDKGLGAPPDIPFETNSGSTKKGISVILHLDTAPDQSCDSHSANAFDATLSLWNLPHVYRAFPQVKDLGSSNQQKPGSYTPTCAQTFNIPSSAMTNDSQSSVKRGPKKAVTRKSHKKAPGRADCHAAQVNVNGVVS